VAGYVYTEEKNKNDKSLIAYIPVNLQPHEFAGAVGFISE
jgi:hypothetical protein